MTEYPAWRKRQCVYCAAGMAMSSAEGYHWNGELRPPECTAKNPDVYIAELEAKLGISKPDRLSPYHGLSFVIMVNDYPESIALSRESADTLVQQLRAKYGEPESDKEPYTRRWIRALTVPLERIV